MWIMISGPYTSNARTEAERQSNLDALNRAAFAVFRLGHTPIVGVNLALPIIRAKGDRHFDEILMPVSLAVARRCDAVLRIGGVSKGADDEVAQFEAEGKPVYHALSEVPRL